MGEISIEHIIILSSKCISNEPIQVKFAPDFGITVFPDCFHTFSESWVNFISCSHLLCTARVFSGEWVNYFSLLSHKFLWVLTHFSKQLTHFSEKDTKPNWITMSTHWRHLVAAYWNCSLNSKYHQHLCELSVHNKSSCSQPIEEVNRLK